jgi:hypothetical protein
VFLSNSLPTWWSIEHGLDLLKQGILWRVESGSKIQIWQDPWLPRAPTRKIIMKRGRSRIRWVSQLMVPGRREWDVPLLKTVIFPHDAQEVVKVWLFDRAPDDHVAWFYEKFGVFSIKSAYHLAVSLDCTDRDQVGCSARTDGRVFKCIWSANVPPKVRVFAWRLSQEGLATQTNRKSRGLEREATCQVCGTEDEFGYHAVVCCSMEVALRHEL